MMTETQRIQMDEDEFRHLVKQMRTEQRRYFKTRSQDALKKSKALEKRVDDELDETRLF